MVLTDGIENSPRWISDVAAEINETTYAVGLGQPQNISVPALQTISGNNGGYLLVTGAISGDNRFLLQKYFLQILAGISNAEVVLDPDGELSRGEVHRIPFQLSDADAGVEVVLLTPRPDAVDFRLQTPNGLLIEPWRATTEPAMAYETGSGLAYYRLALPTQLRPNRFDQAGTWHAILTIGRPRTEPTPDDGDNTDLSILRGRVGPRRQVPERRPFEFERAYAVAAAAATDRLERGPVEAAAQRRGLPYSLVVHTYSSVSLRADVDQDSREPGASVRLRAELTQSGLPVEGDPFVWAELTRPDGASSTLTLAAGDPGEFAATFTADRPGVYTARVRARGRTRVGRPFTREQTLTAAVWRGGDVVVDPAGLGRRSRGTAVRVRAARLPAEERLRRRAPREAPARHRGRPRRRAEVPGEVPAQAPDARPLKATGMSSARGGVVGRGRGRRWPRRHGHRPAAGGRGPVGGGAGAQPLRPAAGRRDAGAVGAAAAARPRRLGPVHRTRVAAVLGHAQRLGVGRRGRALPPGQRPGQRLARRPSGVRPDARGRRRSKPERRC